MSKAHTVVLVLLVAAVGYLGYDKYERDHPTPTVYPASFVVTPTTADPVLSLELRVRRLEQELAAVEACATGRVGAVFACKVGH